jgi:hypothetical protein
MEKFHQTSLKMNHLQLLPTPDFFMQQQMNRRGCVSGPNFSFSTTHTILCSFFSPPLSYQAASGLH